MSNDNLGAESPNTGDTAPIEAMTDWKGDRRDLDLDKYPDDAQAHEGVATRPSGQGGKTPKSRPDYQDMFPKNPEPSDIAKEWGEKVDEVGQVRAAGEAISEQAKTSGRGSGNTKRGPNKGTESAVSSGPKNS
jgi:hypothetical protein